MTKYELVKETKPDGAIIYYIRENGTDMNYTITFDLYEARRYLSILSKGKKQVIDTIKINN
jgi:hypothetical protein